jgi:hypothetical protein
MTSVSMIVRTPEHNIALRETFARNYVKYDGAPFMGLLSPSSTLIPESTVTRLRDHLRGVDAWYRGVLKVYQELLSDTEANHPLLQALEWGLDEHARRLQRESALRGDHPVVGRLDCVDLGSDNFIAEVQWKGAGEGWLAAIDRSYRELLPLQSGHEKLGDLVDAWAQHFSNDGCSVNTGRVGWMDAEVFLVRELAAKGVTLTSLPPGDVQKALAFDGAQPVISDDGQRTAMRHLYLDRLTEVLDPTVLDRLVAAYADGHLVIDPPPSYLFNQKLPMSLPFSGPFKGYFDDSVRRALIPTVWLSTTASKSDLSPLVPLVQHPEADRLTCLANWDDVSELPAELRALLVLKCGSADQNDNHGGHGVHRLDGPVGQARRTLDGVLRRIRDTGEPWMMQPYLGRQWRVPIALPSRPDETVEADLHAKFGIYFKLPGQSRLTPELLGGVASLGTSWKVSGASKTPARIDGAGQLTGAFRHDIRVEVGR